MRLIDADKLKKHYSWWEDERQKLFDEIIDRQQTVDAVPVVRCRDCMWYGIEELKSDGTPDMRYKPTFCFLHRTGIDADGYCSFGKEDRGYENRV